MKLKYVSSSFSTTSLRDKIDAKLLQGALFVSMNRHLLLYSGVEGLCKRERIVPPLEEPSDKKMIFITLTSKANGRSDAQIRQTLERTIGEVMTPGIDIEKITVVSAPPTREERPLSAGGEPAISLTAREEEKPPPKFYYTLDEKQWWEIPGELSKVWQLKFSPKDIGATGGVVKVRGELGGQKVEGWIQIRSIQRHVIELAEP